jgi:superfamily I DNA/RNA helicase
VLEDDSVKSLLYRDATLILGFKKEIGERAYNCKIEGNCKIDIEKKECQICKKYWQIMSHCNYIDFDDQVLFACELLENFHDLLNEYQVRSQHLLVDEYQDINSAQFRLIELLSRKSRNGLFAVGDDGQSIYGFRGGSPEFILRFDKDFLEHLFHR